MCCLLCSLSVTSLLSALMSVATLNKLWKERRSSKSNEQKKEALLHIRLKLVLFSKIELCKHIFWKFRSSNLFYKSCSHQNVQQLPLKKIKIFFKSFCRTTTHLLYVFLHCTGDTVRGMHVRFNVLNRWEKTEMDFGRIANRYQPRSRFSTIAS